MNTNINPKSIHKPIGAYSHSVRIPAGSDLLVVAGQVGMDAKGKLQGGIRKQAEQAFRNVLACLKESGMSKRDLVRMQVFLTDPRHITDYRAARGKVMGENAMPASTLLIVDGLASPDMLIEVEAMAAKG